MIRNWRLDWGQGDFPFLIVQLANFRSPAEYEQGSDWARLREAQLQVLDEPETAMAVTIDIGDAADVHPKNKKDVGERLALCALAKAYTTRTGFSGPTYREHFVDGNGIRLHFDHVADGLASSAGDLKTFVIAGENQVFHPAMATIEGDTVFVSSRLVPSPVAVRYAWADNPKGCNLINSTGLPASPFRTDFWP
jgi:sialate O-acetylesterase